MWNRNPSRLLSVAWLGAALFALPHLTSRADDTSRRAAEALLVDHWDKSASVSLELPAAYQPASSAVATDPRWMQAYVLNRIHYFRYRDALPVAEKLAERQPELLEAWFMRAWLNGILTRFDRALIEVQLYAQRLVAASQAGLMEQAFLERHAGRLGRLYAFLEGPVKEHVHAGTMRETLREIERGLDEPLLKIFEWERQDVLAQFDQLQQDRDDATARSEQDWQIKSQQDLQQLDASDDQLRQRREQVAQELTRAQDDGRRQLDELSSRLAPLQADVRLMADRLSRLEWDWLAVSQALAREQACLLHEDDPFRRSLILARIDQLRWQLRQLDAELFAARGQLATAQQQLAAGQAQGRHLTTSLNRQVAALQGELNQIQRAQRQNQNRRDRIARGSAPLPPEVRNIRDHLKVLSTYDPFPVESERQRLLDELRSAALAGG